MGFAFLPVAIGSVVGGLLGGHLVQRFVRESGHPEGMWWVISGIGFVATVVMVLYDRCVAPHSAASLRIHPDHPLDRPAQTVQNDFGLRLNMMQSTSGR